MSAFSRKVGKVALVVFGLLVVSIGGFIVYSVATIENKMSFPATPSPAVTITQDPALIERGRYLVHGPAHCAQCHGTDQRDKPELNKEEVALTGGLPFAMGPMGTLYAANLTPDPETGIGQRTDAALARTLRTGVLHDGKLSIFMRYAAANLADEDIAAVIAYLRSRPPVKRAVPPSEIKVLGKVMLGQAPFAPRSSESPRAVQPGLEPSVERGAYLAENVALCVLCHTKLNRMSLQPEGPKAAGGNVEASAGSDANMEIVPPNLTADPTGYTGRADEEAFIARLRTGRAIPSSIMPWENVSKMTESDMRSIYRYLRTLPPVKNDVGPVYRKQGWKPGQPPV